MSRINSHYHLVVSNVTEEDGGVATTVKP
jgi:hypothetical protein